MRKGQNLYIHAKKVIAGGTQLLSKRPEMFLPENWPAYYSRAKGCEVWDMDKKHYYDMSLMGVGANVLGYAYQPVDDAAKRAIDLGGMCTLNAPEEVDLAELLLKLHPWAGMVRYAKTGGEAMAIATRIVRAHTKKDIVLVCGYHGWHDWYLAANLVQGDPLANIHLKGLDPLGVPSNLAGSNLTFRYNDLTHFKTLIAENKGNVAAVIMEPVRNEYPKNNFLEEIREITREQNIVLIFDEISSGFRLCCGGSHLKLGISPDIAVFAKAMTNGYPLAAIIGKDNIMATAQDTFISSTFWTERIALAATIVAIEEYQKHHVENHLELIGKQVQAGWKMIGNKYNIPLHVSGMYPMSHFDFQIDNNLAYKTYFTQEMLKKGYLASTGLYASLAHTSDIVHQYLQDCDIIFQKIANVINSNQNISTFLEGPICHAGFERLN